MYVHIYSTYIHIYNSEIDKRDHVRVETIGVHQLSDSEAGLSRPVEQVGVLGELRRNIYYSLHCGYCSEVYVCVYVLCSVSVS